MNISALSNLLSQQAIKSVAKAKELAEQKSQSFLIPEEPEPVSKQASPHSYECKTSTDQTIGANPQYSERDFLFRCSVPDMVCTILYNGEVDEKHNETNLKLATIVNQYFQEVRGEFSCPTSDYMPYMPGLPEFDPAIEKAMRAALNKLVTDDPECEKLIKKKGGIFPPPDYLDFSNMIGGNFRKINEVMAETKRVLQMVDFYA